MREITEPLESPRGLQALKQILAGQSRRCVYLNVAVDWANGVSSLMGTAPADMAEAGSARERHGDPASCGNPKETGL